MALAGSPAGRHQVPSPTLRGTPGFNLGSRSSAQIKNNEYRSCHNCSDSEGLEEVSYILPHAGLRLYLRPTGEGWLEDSARESERFHQLNRRSGRAVGGGDGEGEAGAAESGERPWALPIFFKQLHTF